MNQPRSIAERFSLATGLYLMAFLLALVLRMVGAAQHPLTDPEAHLALQALALSRGQTVQLSPDAAYLTLTTLWMFLFNAGNWVARFWPALAGSLLVLLPVLFQNRLGKLAAVILAFALALDPILLGISRQAGSLPLALFFTLLAAGLWYEKGSPMAGIALGMALLSGPALWPGLIALAGAAWAVMPRRPSPAPSLMEVDETAQPPSNGRPANLRLVLLLALGTVFFVGTLFFSIPLGLSAMAGSLPAYLSGWAVPTNAPLGLALIALLAYALLPVLLGLWGGIRGLLQGDTLDRFLLTWWGAALILALVYPGRQVADIAWSMLPLWALAARQIARQVQAVAEMPAEDRLPMLGQSVLVAVILGFLSMNAVALTNNPQAALSQREYQIRLVGAVVMLVASTGLIAWGWAKSVALRGMIGGVVAILALYSLASGWDAAGLSSRYSNELLGSPVVESAGLLKQSIMQLREMAPNKTNALDVVVVKFPKDSLRWVLRNEAGLSFVDALPGDASPAMVITADAPDLALSASYRGQSLDWLAQTGWQQVSPADWFRWIVFRTVPAGQVQNDRIILWARADLFPGGEQVQQPPFSIEPTQPELIAPQ